MQSTKTSYLSGEAVQIVECCVKSKVLEIRKLDRLIAVLEQGTGTGFSWIPEARDVGSFTIWDPAQKTFSGFDILDKWTDRPRYGFVCDFDSISDGRSVADNLRKYSSNAAQFYDWHFRHEDLVSPHDQFIDPIGRKVSHSSAKKLIAALQNQGIAAMGYVAAYATSNKGAEEHPEWLLYDPTGTPEDFHGFLKITDTSKGSPFLARILDESDRALTEMGFDGVHFDQYGEPKSGFNLAGKSIDVGASLIEVIDGFKSRNPQIPSTLNGVKNWPRELLAASNQDFYYMELWEETNGTLKDLIEEVIFARNGSGNKGVVVAIYIELGNRGSNQIVDSLIHASGAWRIEFGQIDGFLSDPYFPKFEESTEAWSDFAQRANNFAVCAGDILRATVPTVSYVSGDGFQLARFDYASQEAQVIALVNLGANEASEKWIDSLIEPERILGFEVVIPVGWEKLDLLWFSEEYPIGRSVESTLLNGESSVQIPELGTWGFIKAEKSE